MSLCSSTSRERDGMHSEHMGPAKGNDGGDVVNIPRRLMQVKVLYTFDDRNISNCLARLPTAVHIPTVALDETTEVGLIELKTCIQAIATASPELAANLGHDYTVYAYDYSEYETPLVGQGMLSWILASASSTPHAPAHQSQTMVTGRVCKNILALFSNGIKETLEVKLKLVPVPKSMQKQYVESMERTHSLGQLQLAHPRPDKPSQSSMHGYIGGFQPEHYNFSRTATSPSSHMNHAYMNLPNIPYGASESRPCSPAMSTASYSTRPAFQESRPGSRASFHSEPVAYAQPYQPEASMLREQQEDLRPKKRVRTTKASRPAKPKIGANKDSLRVTASAAASVRLHGPAPTNLQSEVATEQVPRAPTPRPSDKFQPQFRGPLRPPAPSLLRHGSVDEGQPYISPFPDSGIMSDNAVDSADDERANSPGNTPMEFPSSPPDMSRMPRHAPSASSSPGLPALPYPSDSGFLSDIPFRRDGYETDNRSVLFDGSDVPIAPDNTKRRKRADRSNLPWLEVKPGPVDLLPTGYESIHRTSPRPGTPVSVGNLELATAPESHTSHDNASANPKDSNITQPALNDQSKRIAESLTDSAPGDSITTASQIRHDSDPSQSTEVPSVESTQSRSCSEQPVESAPRINTEETEHHDIINPNASTLAPTSICSSRSTTPKHSRKCSRISKPPVLPRSQTWSADSTSDTAASLNGTSRGPRSGSGARRRENIAQKLQECIDAGKMPPHCWWCGNIETPTWRRAYTLLQHGFPNDIPVSSEGTSIVAYQISERRSLEEPPSYSIFKLALAPGDKENGWSQIALCNPCGLWVHKKNTMRPQDVWEKSRGTAEGKPKRKRNSTRGPRKKVKHSNDDVQSDAAVPYSEPVMPSTTQEAAGFDRSINNDTHHSVRPRAESFQTASDMGVYGMDETSAEAALLRAIQSSPAGIYGSKNSPIELAADSPPRPTRRLLFPSPRRAGEIKSLGDTRSSMSPSTGTQTQRTGESVTPSANIEPDDIDKENLPPPEKDAHDDLAHLFEEDVSPKTTPTKGKGQTPRAQGLLTTPIPSSRRRTALTPKRGTENVAEYLLSPSRKMITPNRGGRTLPVAPDTPMTRQLNALLSDYLQSPPQNIDLSAFPAFELAAAETTRFCEFMPDDFLSSDLPMPSSPPADLGFSLYEDPATSTPGLWSGGSIFGGSDAIIDTEEHGQEKGHGQQSGDGVALTTGISVDFAAMIQEVVGNGDANPLLEQDENDNTEKNTQAVEPAA